MTSKIQGLAARLETAWSPALLAASVLAAATFGACSANDQGTPGAGGGAAAGGGGGAAASGSGGGMGALGGTGGGGGLLEDSPYKPGDVLTIVGPGADQSAGTKFGGSVDPGAAVTIEYPPSGIILPLNMNKLEIHWVPAAGQTLFELSYQSATLKLIEYVGCVEPLNGGCSHAPDPAFWTELANAARGGAAVTWSIRGVNGATPGSVGQSDERTFWITKEPITGGLYYWNTGGSIVRFDFGYPVQEGEDFLTPFTAGAGLCIGCHALSRDGAKISFGRDFPGLSPYSVFSVQTRQQMNTAGGAPITGNGYAFYSFSPEGSQMLLASGNRIDQQDLSTGAIIQGVVPQASQPDWSPSGAKMVYANPSGVAFGMGASVTSAAIGTADYVGGAWTNHKLIVPFDGANNYYPAFAPIEEWVLFNRSPLNNNSMSNGAPPDPEAGVAKQDGELWYVNANGGQHVLLAAATGGKWTSWPKWAPGIYTYDGNRKAMFFTFSSGRAFGLRLYEEQRVQLWMSAFDPDRAAAGQDASTPSYWFPYQKKGGNHIAQWVTSVLRKPCNASTDCTGNEVCTAGSCYPEIR